MADQLERKRIRPAGTFDAELLELAMLEWLARHRNDITIGLRRGDMANVELLSDNWTDAEFRACAWSAKHAAITTRWQS